MPFALAEYRLNWHLLHIKYQEADATIPTVLDSL